MAAFSGLQVSLAIVSGAAEWFALRDKRLLNAAVVLEYMGDIHPEFQCRIDAKRVLVKNCDKNFVYYWLKPQSTLADTTELYLNSHPCEGNVLWAWGNCPGKKLFLHEHYATYKERWAHDIDNVIVLPKTHEAWKVESWGLVEPVKTEPFSPFC